MDERAYTEGNNAAWRTVLAEAVRHLGNPEGTAEQWRVERAAAVAMLRAICNDFGDNDWEDNLHLADVVEKHLYRHLNDNPPR